MAVALIFLLILSCLGAGAMLLSAGRLLADRSGTEKLALSFAIGFGFIGWLFFWLGTIGLYSQSIAWIVCILLAAGVYPMRRHLRLNFSQMSLSRLEWLLVICIAIAFAADFLEALAPPVEADSLAYHFQLPKQFIAEGHLIFIPRALDGAIPLLVQMTYVAALLLGGGEETVLTLWTFISGWGAGLLLFAFARRCDLSVVWSLALLLLFQTLPAMLYSGGSGQVEPRIAMFALVAAFGLLDLRKNTTLGPILLIGLGAGLFAASKYTGLFFLVAAGLSLLLFSGRNWFRNGLAYGLVALLAGFQWYGWNAWHTGDPVFPVLFTALGLEGGPIWDADYAASMKDYLALRHDQIDWWQRWLAYPVVATLFPAPAMEAGRVGLGPYFLMISPITIAGIWHYRLRICANALAPVALMALLFYVLWLGFGSIPKVRHLIPIVPVVLVCLAAGAAKAIENWPQLRHATALAMVLSLLINAAVIMFFVRPYAAYALAGFDKETFLTDNINGYPAVAWLNKQDDIDKVLLTYRAFHFYVHPASFYAYPGVQKQIEARAGHVETTMFWKQMRKLGISHILTDRPTLMSTGTASIDSAIHELADVNCLIRQKELRVPWRISRTLPALGNRQSWFDIWRLNTESCSFNK